MKTFWRVFGQEEERKKDKRIHVFFSGVHEKVLFSKWGENCEENWTNYLDKNVPATFFFACSS